MDTVGTGVGVFTTGDDHQEIRFTEGNLLLLLVVFADEIHQLFEVLCTVFYLRATQFAFNEGVAAIFQMKDNIGFQSVAVTVVGDYTIKRG